MIQLNTISVKTPFHNFDYSQSPDCTVTPKAMLETLRSLKAKLALLIIQLTVSIYFRQVYYTTAKYGFSIPFLLPYEYEQVLLSLPSIKHFLAAIHWLKVSLLEN